MDQFQEQERAESFQFLKAGIWAYFLLLIFEGALRKWFLPGLATPLLIIRDPIALWLIYQTWKRGLLLTNPYLLSITLIGVVGIFTSILLGHGSLPVALFGARILLLHFPLMFVIGYLFTREDVVKLGKITLWISIPMVVLVVLQFYSPQSAWVNRGVGGNMEGAGFSGALDFFRPPGTFSFTNGNTLFFSFVACFVFYFLLHPKSINWILLIGATVALLISIPISISRGLFFQVGVSLIFALLAAFRKPKYVTKLIPAVLLGVIMLIALSQTSVFKTAAGAFLARFEVANEAEGGMEGVLIDRFLGGMIGAITESSDLPFWGYGLGMGTNVGSMLLTGGTTFLIAEGEWGRVIGESGVLMGLTIIFIRLSLSIKMAVASYHKLVQDDILPWMLLSFSLLIIPQGQWAQPTSLGFSAMVGGLLLAALKDINPRD
ncbi:hypothetical protein [Adhaeribacter pallidiroseus]|uniref:hypothetical protein n=1 Tax=Adhaeribacter pallidiroseus TaxID=2072847 RepID=UPI000E1BC595|nr:hypothetical protein [Adhaeribacter pallidiroseus]